MQRRAGRLGGACALVVFGAALAACGSTTQLPEAPATGALAASPLPVTQTGNAAARIDPKSVTLHLDNTGGLVVHVSATSTAADAETIMVRGSLLSANGTPVGDVTGGAIDIAPGATVQLELTGPAPNGTVASATFEVSTAASPPSSAATPSGALGTPSAS
jgi:hypothetical protein